MFNGHLASFQSWKTKKITGLTVRYKAKVSLGIEPAADGLQNQRLNLQAK